MDTEYALLVLEIELDDESKLNRDQFDRLAEAVIAAASAFSGYYLFAWQSGKRLIDMGTKSLAVDGATLFESFGWRALAIGIKNALADGRILDGLSYRITQFVPPTIASSSLFDHPEVAKAIDDGFAINPRPFVRPADLGVADHRVQSEFVVLLRKLSQQDRDQELLKQWCSAALRVIPTQSQIHLAFAETLIQILQKDKRPITTYYVFRALAELHRVLWEQPLAVEVLKPLIGRCYDEEGPGKDLLVDYCTDDDVLRALNSNHELLTVTGILAIALSRKYAESRVEPTAWQFIGEMYASSPIFAYTLESYLIDGVLPDLPKKWREQVIILEKQVADALSRAEKELRHRRYGKLATQIHQQNMKDTFHPIISDIKQGNCTEAFVQYIQRIDPEELVAGSSLQQVSTRQTGKAVTRKMAGEMKRALEALENAARKKIELEQVQDEILSRDLSEFDLYLEFEDVSENLGSVPLWAMQALLSPLWQRLMEGISVTEQELEALSHATRQHQ